MPSRCLALLGVTQVRRRSMKAAAPTASRTVISQCSAVCQRLREFGDDAALHVAAGP